MNNSHERKNSGQLLIVSALTIAVLISSTSMYVYNLSRETYTSDTPPITDLVLALKQTTRNAIISSLANISNGGAKSSLITNLDRLSAVLRNARQYGIHNLAYAVRNDSTYDSGTQLLWNSSDTGASSAFVNFTLQILGSTSTITSKYPVNVTTSLLVSGSYVALTGGGKNVSLTCRVNNEGDPALAKSLTVFYDNGGNWTEADSSNNLSIQDFGNGTYYVSFTVAVEAPVQASVHVVDARDVFVRANTTCSAP